MKFRYSRHSLFVCCFGALLWACAGAWAQTPAPLTPDRPGFTNSSQTVAPGRVVVESGLAQTRDRAANDRAANGGTVTDDYPETLLRFGTARDLELQLGLPNYNAIHGGSRGFGDAYLGAKIKLYQRGQTLASVAPGLSVPFGRRDFRSSNPLPSLLFGVDTALGKRASFSVNLTLSQTQQGGDAGSSGGGSGNSAGQSQSARHNQFTLAPAASVSYSLTPKLGLYLDGYAIVPRRGGATAVVDGGFTYLLSNNLQLDLEAGHGLGGAASPNRFYGGGVAFRF